MPNVDATNATNISSGTINISRTPTTVRNSTIAIDSTTGVITGITGGNVAIRNDKTTKANVGLANVDNVNQATIITNARANTTAADVGLDNVDNVNQATIITNARANTTKADVGLGSVDNVNQATIITNARANTTKADVGLSAVPNVDATNATNISSGTINISRTPTTVRNSTVQLSAAGVLTGAGTSSQVNIGSIASTPFDTSGDVNTGQTIAVGSKITIDRDNERILIED